MASRRTVEAVRFDVPEARVTTLIRRYGTQTVDVPEASAELRSLADERGVAFAVDDRGTGLVVVPVPNSSAAGARGYVAARVALDPFDRDLVSVAETRFDEAEAHLLVADGRRRVVAGHDPAKLTRGSDAQALPGWNVLKSSVHGVAGPSSRSAARAFGTQNRTVVGSALLKSVPSPSLP